MTPDPAEGPGEQSRLFNNRESCPSGRLRPRSLLPVYVLSFALARPAIPYRLIPANGQRRHTPRERVLHTTGRQGATFQVSRERVRYPFLGRVCFPSHHHRTTSITRPGMRSAPGALSSTGKARGRLPPAGGLLSVHVHALSTAGKLLTMQHGRCVAG